MRSVNSATVHRRQLELPREICPVSFRRLREPRGDLTAGHKSAEGVVDHVVGEDLSAAVPHFLQRIEDRLPENGLEPV
jgi:hypothetical protein